MHRFCISLRFWYLVLELFWQCGMFVFHLFLRFSYLYFEIVLTVWYFFVFILLLLFYIIFNFYLFVCSLFIIFIHISLVFRQHFHYCNLVRPSLWSIFSIYSYQLNSRKIIRWDGMWLLVEIKLTTSIQWLEYYRDILLFR